jgi:homeobox protein cut-like
MTDAATPPPIAEWQALDWEATLSGMEAVLQASREAQKVSLQNRKSLSETTKQFKRSVKNVEQAASSLSEGGDVSTAVKVIEALSVECRGTVKAYQEEIDKLTRRCKTAEAAYTGLATSIGDKSDPAALFAQQTSQMNQLLRTVDQVNQELLVQEKTVTNYKKEIQQLKAIVASTGAGGGGSSSGLSKGEREELVSLRKDVSEYEVEFRSLKNQDITIRKLEARIAELQTSGEENMQDQLEKYKQELEETEGRRVAEALEREAGLERKVETLELQLKAERAGREATQTHLLQEDEGVSQREAAWEAQRRILVDDSHRIRESLQTATRERDGLRLQVAALEGKKAQAPFSGGMAPADFALERKAYEAEVTELSETASLLREELKTKEDMLADVNRSSGLKIDSLERDSKNLQSKLLMLQADLGAAPTQTLVDSMRRELRILKRLEYNADDVDADLDPEIAGDEKDLESVLVSKLRRAESELVTERIGRTDLVKEVDSLRDAVTNVKKEKTDADNLIQALERDLEKAIAAAPSQSSTTTAKEPPTKVHEVGSATLESVMDPEATPSPGRPPSPTPMSVSLRRSTSEKADDDHSVATIVMAQRDRLRARCEALEAERDSFKRELQGQVQASESLKTDNTKLYEKVRYLQNYNKGPSNRQGLDRDLDLETLEQRYEASVDPFRQFNRTERQRKLNEMSPMERTVFIVAKSVLATKEMRTALFFYVLTLHLLVFSTTTHWSHSEACNSNNNEHLAILPHEQQTAHLRGGDAP